MNVFDIQRGSYHDGPGIRTVVFLKGCNLSCTWCQNPESQKIKPQMMYYEELCSGCMECVKSCPAQALSLKDGRIYYKKENCLLCRKCESACWYQARTFSGKECSTEEILKEVLKDEEMYRISGGGVTLSGGEPLLQAEACREVLKELKKREIHTLIETAGNVNWEAIEKVLPYTDCIYMDLKQADDEIHKKYCGCSNRMILENIRRLAKETVGFTVRTPVIPGVNDKEDDIRIMAGFLKECGIENYELLAFHTLGSNKYTALGREYEWKKENMLKKERMAELRKIAEKEVGMKK